MKSEMLDTTEGRINLPDGWSQCHLSDILAVIRGVTYKKSDARENPDTGLIGILRATNINGELDFDDLVCVPSKYVNDAQRLRIGDIVVAASSGSRNVVGKAALLRHDWTGSFGAFCYGLRPVQATDARYVAYFLQTTEYRQRVSELSAGININNLQRNHIENMPIRLASLREQRRIVEEIEKQFTRLDAGVAALKRVEVNLKRYKAAVLKAAVEGRLTARWRAEHPNVEPASELLKRILKERRRRWEDAELAKMLARGKPPTDERWKKKYRGPIAPNADALPPLPNGWTWATVEQVSHLIQYGSSAKASENAIGVPILRMGNITTDGRIDDADLKYLPAEHEEFPALLLADGDLLFNRTNSAELVGKSAVYRGRPDPCSFASYLIRVRTLPDAASVFVAACVNSSHGRR